MELVVTLLSSLGAVVVIVFGIAVQAGAGSTIVGKLDRMFEQRFAARAIVVDVAPDRKKRHT